MALYLIATESSVTDEEPVPSDLRVVEAKNIKEAARELVTDDAPNKLTAQIWRVAGPSKRITLRVKTSVSVEVE